jgi:hypothetical protein
MKIGIDFSINSTAVSVIKGNSIHLFSFVPNYRPELSAYKIHRALGELITVISYDKAVNTKDPIRDQAIKLENADNLSNKIIEAISPLIDEEVDVRIEGFSFGSKGNSFIDLVTYNTFLKVKIIQKWGHCISVIPPKSLKKLYTGNGNASKCDMVRSFIEKSDSAFRNKLVELEYNKEGEFVIGKPVDDLVDSLALAEVLLVSTCMSPLV